MNRRLLGHAVAGLLLVASVVVANPIPAAPTMAQAATGGPAQVEVVASEEPPVAIPLPSPTPLEVEHYSRETTDMELPTRPPVPLNQATLIPYLLWPVPGGTISQVFHAGHGAVDIGANCGTPAIAATAGLVVYSGWKLNGGGIVIDIQFDNGLLGSYNHLQANYVATGTRVEEGQVVGEIGMTGIATGCHLHFAVSAGGRLLNPASFW